MMIAGVFCGCGGEKKVNTGEKFTYWGTMVGAASQTITSYNELLMYQEMSKATGTEVEFIHPVSGSTGTEAFQILLSSGDYPDMIEYNWKSYAGGTDRAIEDGVIISLNEYLEASKKTADYFLEHVKKSNYKTVTDFAAPTDVGLFDNSAGACASCGMIELYKITKDEKYLDGAIKILKAMEEDCIFDDSNQSIVQKCMLSYSDGKHVDLIYADFFLCEAILKLKGSDYLIW